MFVAAFIGIMTAVVAIGLLPVFENLFKITTDITLLELTDYNHPLLRKLQISAPGSYHHSLMVANLAERAASEISANPLLCRACALYHDIGKVVKPEYFAENNRDGFDPHQDVSPSMSALIIKSHIDEGLSLAQQYKLPKVTRDVIAQHHGTTLIKFFYHKAAKQQRLLTHSPFGRQRAAEAKTTATEISVQPNETGVDESFYRYEGPKPNFKESAIIALADCVEAASRSLRKITPQSVEELIETIINDRIEDHQLDDSPITILELKRIKESFTITLLNMLHSRVQYPGQEEAETPARGKNRDKNIVPMTPPAAAPAPPPKPSADNGPASSASA
jgi:putative nucleotidyltransferase with HDIG domain